MGTPVGPETRRKLKDDGRRKGAMTSHADPEEKDGQVQDQLAAFAVEVDPAHVRRVSAVSPAEAPAPGLRELRLLRWQAGPRGGVRGATDSRAS